jgi:hypothetical protein
VRRNRYRRRNVDAVVFSVSITVAWASGATAGAAPDAVLFAGFENDQTPEVRLHHGTKRVTGKFAAALEFNNALQRAEVEFSRRLEGLRRRASGRG